MPSELTVPITEIKNLRKHPDADSLELCDVLGWQLVVGKDLYKEGQRIVYVPPDSIMPQELSDELDITKFLSKGRVRQVKLRGEPSFGATVPLEALEKRGIDPNLPLGTNVATELGITKYEPPVRESAGDAEAEHVLFQKYTSISNLRNYPDILREGELVNITEKIHGTNSRVGIIDNEYVAGSHSLQRKNPYDGTDLEDAISAWKLNTYWFPLFYEPVRKLLGHVKQVYNANQVILYGEVYGKVQKKYSYDAEGKLGYRAFDLLVDGKYVEFALFDKFCQDFGVATVPITQNMPYNYESIVGMVEGMANKSLLNENHPMEGVVIKPLIERTDPKIGRVILKYLSNAYLFDKGGSDFTDR